ncbi:24279_t:CDS:2, partial [Racocetra persica]
TKECPEERSEGHPEECSEECPEEHPEEHPEERSEERPDKSRPNESSSQYFKKGKSNAICGICNTTLTYNDRTTLNLLKHLKRHKAKVSELRESSVEGGVG